MNIQALIEHVERKGISLTYLEAMRVVKLANKKVNLDRSLGDLIDEVLGGP